MSTVDWTKIPGTERSEAYRNAYETTRQERMMNDVAGMFGDKSAAFDPDAVVKKASDTVENQRRAETAAEDIALTKAALSGRPMDTQPNTGSSDEDNLAFLAGLNDEYQRRVAELGGTNQQIADLGQQIDDRAKAFRQNSRAGAMFDIASAMINAFGTGAGAYSQDASNMVGNAREGYKEDRRDMENRLRYLQQLQGKQSNGISQYGASMARILNDRNKQEGVQNRADERNSLTRERLGLEQDKLDYYKTRDGEKNDIARQNANTAAVRANTSAQAEARRNGEKPLTETQKMQKAKANYGEFLEEVAQSLGKSSWAEVTKMRTNDTNVASLVNELNNPKVNQANVISKYSAKLAPSFKKKYLDGESSADAAPAPAAPSSPSKPKFGSYKNGGSTKSGDLKGIMGK